MGVGGRSMAEKCEVPARRSHLRCEFFPVLEMVRAAASAMAPSHVGAKAAKSIRRRLRRRVSRPTEVEFQSWRMARVGSSTDWQRLRSVRLDGEEALRVSTSQGPSTGQWLRLLLSVPGEGARCYDGAINNFLQDCRRALRTQKATEPDSQGAEPRAALESSQATDLDDQAAEPSELPGSSMDSCPFPKAPPAKVGRAAFLLESDSEAEAAAAAPSHKPQEQQRPVRKKSRRRMAKSSSFEKKRRAAAGWATLDVRARKMRLHFDQFEILHVPATEESVGMLLAELSPRKGERRRKKAVHSCAEAFRDMLEEEDHGRVAWRAHSWQVHWRSKEGCNKRCSGGFRVRDTGEPDTDMAAARTALRRARALWNKEKSTGEIPYPLHLL